MTDGQNDKLDALHRYFMEPRRPGKPSRAEEIDTLLETVTTTKLSVRAVLWALGCIAAMLALWSQAKDFLK